MNSPSKLHLIAAKKILRHIKGTINFGIFYERGKEEDYVDSDWAGSFDDGKKH